MDFKPAGFELPFARVAGPLLLELACPTWAMGQAAGGRSGILLIAALRWRQRGAGSLGVFGGSTPCSRGHSVTSYAIGSPVPPPAPVSNAATHSQ